MVISGIKATLDELIEFCKKNGLNTDDLPVVESDSRLQKIRRKVRGIADLLGVEIIDVGYSPDGQLPFRVGFCTNLTDNNTWIKDYFTITVLFENMDMKFSKTKYRYLLQEEFFMARELVEAGSFDREGNVVIAVD